MHVATLAVTMLLLLHWLLQCYCCYTGCYNVIVATLAVIMLLLLHWLLQWYLQGKADNFLGAGQLLPDTFVAACAEAKVPVILRMQEVINEELNLKL